MPKEEAEVVVESVEEEEEEVVVVVEIETVGERLTETTEIGENEKDWQLIEIETE